MSIFQEIRSTTWAFLEVYGWLTVFLVILAYVIYKKYIYNFRMARDAEKRLIEQKKFDRESREKDAEKMREAREKQQKEHDVLAELERARRAQKEREEAEKRRKEAQEAEKTCQVLGRSPNPPTPPRVTRNPRHQAIDLVDNLSGSASIVIFGHSTCPEFRKACQLVATYRLDASKFQIFEMDKQTTWPVEEVEKVIATRHGAPKSPFVFVCGEFIGGLQEAREYDREHGLERAHLSMF